MSNKTGLANALQKLRLPLNTLNALACIYRHIFVKRCFDNKEIRLRDHAVIHFIQIDAGT